jgi:hypothetical protein
MAFEDSGSGTQLVRLRVWPRIPVTVTVPIGGLAAFAAGAMTAGAIPLAIASGTGAASVAWVALRQCGRAISAAHHAAIETGLVTNAAAMERRRPVPVSVPAPMPTVAFVVAQEPLPKQAALKSIKARHSVAKVTPESLRRAPHHTGTGAHGS